MTCCVTSHITRHCLWKIDSVDELGGKEILQSNNVVWPEKPPRSSFPKEESGRKIRVGKSGNETGN